MWEAIQSNIRRSRWLIGLMGALLVLLGSLIGAAWAGPEGGPAGAVAALGFWLVLLLVALTGGEQVLLRSARAREIAKHDYPRLWNVVEEMTIASGLGSMPRVFVIDDPAPNAFATGRRPDTAAVAVTSGLLKRLNRDELQGVVAHEIGHIRNYDIRFLTIASVMLGGIVILSDVFFRSLWFGGGRRRDSGGGHAQLVILAVTLLVAVLAPICAQLLYFACSRRREYLADASAARYTRYPAGLASALEKIAAGQKRGGRAGVQRALAPLYIVNPLQAAGSAGRWTATHPPTADRIRILRAMGGQAGWVDYERAYRSVVGGGRTCLSDRLLGSETSVTARAPSSEPAGRAVDRAREVTDLLDRFVNLLVIACPCGVRIKVPPALASDSVACPRCARQHAIPSAKREPDAPVRA